MTYSKTFNPERYNPIERAISALKELKPGHEATLTAVSPEALVKMRTLLYDYLFHTGLKADFRLKVLSPVKLLIQRLQSDLIQKVESEKLSPFVEELIDVWEEDEKRMAIVDSWIKESRLSEKEAQAVVEQVERIMS